MKELGLLSLENRREKENLITIFENKNNGYYNKDGNQILSVVSGGMRSNGLKLHKGRFTLAIRKNFLITRVVKYWDRLPRAGIDSSSLEVFNCRLGRPVSGITLY